MIDRTLSDSAFLVNESRARAEQLSGDPFAKLWVDDSVRALWERYNSEIYPYDPIELAVRNRFFLGHTQSFFSENPNGVFVNVAAGFTSYPYIFREPVTSIELDRPNVINYKSQRVKEFQHAGLMPLRDVSYLECDLNSPSDQLHIQKALKKFIGMKPSFILLEGITYYLEKKAFVSLVEMFSSLQATGSIFAMDYWVPEVESNKVFQRYCDFFERRCGHPKGSYNLLTPELIASFDGYRIQTLSDVAEHEKVISEAPILPAWHEILPENYAMLERLHRCFVAM